MVDDDVDGPHGEGTDGEEGAVETSEAREERCWTELGVRPEAEVGAVRCFFAGWA